MSELKKGELVICISVISHDTKLLLMASRFIQAN